MGYPIHSHSAVKVADLNEVETARWMASKLPWDGTLPRPGILFTLDKALEIARSPSDPDGLKDKAVKLFDILEKRIAVYVELGAFLKYPKNHFELQWRTKDNWLDVVFQLVKEWDRVNAVAEKAYMAVHRESRQDLVDVAKSFDDFQRDSRLCGPRYSRRARSSSAWIASQSNVGTLYDRMSEYAPASEYGASLTAWKWTRDSLARGARETETCSSIIDRRPSVVTGRAS